VKIPQSEPFDCCGAVCPCQLTLSPTKSYIPLNIYRSNRTYRRVCPFCLYVRPRGIGRDSTTSVTSRQGPSGTYTANVINAFGVVSFSHRIKVLYTLLFEVDGCGDPVHISHIDRDQYQILGEYINLSSAIVFGRITVGIPFWSIVSHLPDHLFRFCCRRMC
jgi:hypothetical protein